MKLSLVHNRRGDGKGTIEIKVYFPKHRRQLYYSTGVLIDSEYFDKDKQAISINTPNYKSVIDKITELQSELTGAIQNFEEDELSGKPNQFHKYFKHFKRQPTGTTKATQRSFLKFMANELADSVELVDSTKTAHSRTLELLTGFNPGLHFEEINWMFAKSFDRYLRSKFTNLNTITKHHEITKRYINLARKALYIKADEHASYIGFKPERQEVDKEILLPDEIEAIEDLNLSGQSILNEVREMFLVAYYTALRISDINELNSKTHLKEIDNNLMLDKVIYKLRKKNRRIKINLSQIHNGKPAEIIRRQMLTENGTIFNQHQTGENVNIYLKKIMKLAGIDKNVSFHTARHSMLTMIAFKTGDVFTVMKYGGISTIQTANRYIHLSSKLFDDKIAQIVWE